MINPFFVTGKIPAEYFCDRGKESERLVALLTNGNNVLLISPRRMGKTELIYHCFDLPAIKGHYITVFVDIMQTTSLNEFIFLLGKAIFETLASKGKKFIFNFIEALKSLSGKFTFDPVTGAPSFSIQLGDITAPEFTLEEIFNFIKSSKTPCIVAIDEFQQIASYPEKNVEAILRTHIQQCTNCNLVFSGSRAHLMGEMFLYPNRPFYNSTSILHLDAIPKEVYSEFAIRLFNKFERDIAPEDIDFVYHKFEGTTFYLQSVLNQAFYMTPSGGKCERGIIENSIKEVIESASGLFREILSGLTIRQKELLIAIAKEGVAANITSSKFISSHGLKSSSSVQAAAKKLSELNIITKSESGYTLTDKFLRLWLQTTY